MEYSDSAVVREYIKENREDVLKMIQHEDTFLRALGFAVLFEGGDKTDIEMVKREMELLEEVEEDFDFY
jgi:hypothetical protein